MARQSLDVGGTSTKTIIGDWVTACTTPATADNSGNEVTNPVALVVADSTRLIDTAGATTIQVCYERPAGATVSQELQVQLFGIGDSMIPGRLYNQDGDHILTLTAAAGDLTDGTSKWCVVDEVDASGYESVTVCVKRALAGTGITGSEILIKGK